ncbi:MAG: 30S ribosomal protein S13 [Patescibacteria group bacterium]|nr:30S ribosomal protein S13 [Patescibacteria group bacterium]
MRILGIDIPDQERAEIAFTKIYGIGRKNVLELLSLANIDPDKRVNKLSKTNLSALIKALEDFEVEGDLRKKVNDNITRLKAVRSYRGIRHILGLPVHGQRTKTNARTRRGGKKTVGALSKEMWSKIESQQRAAMAKTN